MALFTVDTNNILGQAVEEAGTYNVVVAPSSQYTTTQQSGNPMAVFDYEVLDGKYKGGRIRFDNEVWDTSTEEKGNLSIKRFNTIAVALGAANGTSFDSIQQFVSQAVGNKLAVTVDWETGQNGKTYLSVKSHKPFMQDGSKPNGVKRPNGSSSQGSGFAQRSSNGFGGQSRNGGFGNAAAPNQANNSVPKQQGGSNSFANQTGAGYKGGQPFDNVPDGLPF
ncbi:prophage P2a protein 18 [Lactiplantibacillus plantarum]|nr:prophage P2a protein 18 [Lactiplantibacillus plantarum]MCG0813601.1 prophage P2a protein 18 [Lactiplantibacillus plantarum]MCG0878971.1 prophage P2a protein 18 [Lactiplantibacillus plantarum]MCG0951466.1 prophage P2a protein 18 [Lactiplantibacillus plantarum]